MVDRLLAVRGGGGGGGDVSVLGLVECALMRAALSVAGNPLSIYINVYIYI